MGEKKEEEEEESKRKKEKKIFTTIQPSPYHISSLPGSVQSRES